MRQEGERIQGVHLDCLPILICEFKHCDQIAIRSGGVVVFVEYCFGFPFGQALSLGLRSKRQPHRHVARCGVAAIPCASSLGKRLLLGRSHDGELCTKTCGYRWPSSGGRSINAQAVGPLTINNQAVGTAG
jgi:hypothetical protein